MGLFKKGLFKRKPGGTKLGNILRGVANKATGGVLGNGLLKVDKDGNGLFYNKDKKEADISLNSVGDALSTKNGENKVFGLTTTKKSNKNLFIAIGGGALALIVTIFAFLGGKKKRR